MTTKTITAFKAKPFRSGNSFVIVVPYSKFKENILAVKEYEFSVKEVQ